MNTKYRLHIGWFYNITTNTQTFSRGHHPVRLSHWPTSWSRWCIIYDDENISNLHTANFIFETFNFFTPTLQNLFSFSPLLSILVSLVIFTLSFTAWLQPAACSLEKKKKKKSHKHGSECFFQCISFNLSLYMCTSLFHYSLLSLYSIFLLSAPPTDIMLLFSLLSLCYMFLCVCLSWTVLLTVFLMLPVAFCCFAGSVCSVYC